MARYFSESDIDRGLILGSKVGVIGFGSQGHAHALNLRDSGADVFVGLHAESASRKWARELGFEVGLVSDVVKQADIIMMCTSDVIMRHVYADSVAPNLRSGQTLLFAHGFNIRYGLIEPPGDIDVAMVSPKGPGPGLRAEFVAGRGLPGLIAVHQDATGAAQAKALAYAWGIGCARVLLMETTFREETETDLFGEQAVLCGGISALVKAGFETLVEAGYQPEVAYFEVLHETRLIVELLVSGGLTYLHERISDTAEWGDFVSGPRVVGDSARRAMADILREIQDGSFAGKWVAEDAAGRPNLKAMRAAERASLIEEIGRDVRARMGFDR